MRYLNVHGRGHGDDDIIDGIVAVIHGSVEGVIGDGTNHAYRQSHLSG